MRTTIEITDALFVQAKKKAAEDGVPLRRLVEAALRNYLTRKARRRYRLRWRTERGKLLPGVDLDDRNSLFEIMEDRK